MQLSKEQLAFLARFQRTPDGSQMLTILRSALADNEKAARAARGEDVHRRLGAADGLDTIISLIEGAQATINRNATSVRRPVAG